MGEELVLTSTWSVVPWQPKFRALCVVEHFLKKGGSWRNVALSTHHAHALLHCMMKVPQCTQKASQVLRACNMPPPEKDADASTVGVQSAEDKENESKEEEAEGKKTEDPETSFEGDLVKDSKEESKSQLGEPESEQDKKETESKSEEHDEKEKSEERIVEAPKKIGEENTIKENEEESKSLEGEPEAELSVRAELRL